MAFEFKLPDIGEGVVEGEVVEWLVAEGDTVTEDQPLVAVMTDKATVEIPSPKAGTVTKLGAAAGEVVPVGSVLVTLEVEGGASAPAKSEAAPAAAPPKLAAAPPPPRTPPPKAAPAPAPAAPAAAVAIAAAPAAPPAPGGKVHASPATRKLARELGVDLAAVRGTGPKGRIQASDVETAAAQPVRPLAASPAHAAAAGTAGLQPVPAPAPLLEIPRGTGAPGERVEERVAVRGLRKIIAKRMVQSKQTAPHFAYVDECDVTELVALRNRMKPQAARYGVKLTYLPFILKALVPALKAHPVVNSSLDTESNEVVYKKYYNLGVATDTENGLTVPVIKDADRKSILEIAAEIQELVGRARSQRATMEDITGGTFTVTSTGNIGGLFATPIINQPEVAILGVPTIKKRPVVLDDGQIVARDMLWLALSLDHRVVDGAVGARFMNTLIEYLSDPTRLLLELS